LNVFYLDHNPTTCAKYHNDKHCVKMILEYAQLMSTAHRILDGDDINPVIYKATHKNHPSAVWVRQSDLNYDWLYKLFEELSHEYNYRYDKQHLSFTKLKDFLRYPPDNIPVGEFTQPTPAMPDYCKVDGDSLASYRKYYINEKSHLAVWKNREVPEWYEK
jgi:hypothetical protein